MADLILALDVQGREKAVAVAQACAGEIDAIKIGYPLVLSTGLGIVKDLAQFGTPIIADFKVADIPNTNTLLAEQVFAETDAGIERLRLPGDVVESVAPEVVEVRHPAEGQPVGSDEFEGDLRALLGDAPAHGPAGGEVAGPGVPVERRSHVVPPGSARRSRASAAFASRSSASSWAGKSQKRVTPFVGLATFST